ncbi:hypothetical protein P2318_27570 [Myxococcaceae bacterium GXIMD 01537]
MSVRLLVMLLALLGAGAASAQEGAPVPAQALPPPPLVTAPDEAGLEPWPTAPSVPVVAPSVPVVAPSPAARPAEVEPLPVASTADEPPRGEVIPYRYQSPIDSFFPMRVTLEMMAGVVGAFAGGATGFLLGVATGTGSCARSECLIIGVVGGIAGVIVGVPAGSYLAAGWMGGQGSFAATVAGGFLGWGAAAVGALLMSQGSDELRASSLALLLLPALGATIGYEISHANNVARGTTARASSPRVMPVAGFTRAGPTLGLAGLF